jgi:uncharacterized protein (DUF2237 family)
LSIVQKKDPKRNGELYYAYKEPEDEELHACCSKIYNDFVEYAKKLGAPLEKASCNMEDLAKVAVRVDQRREYYRIFHENTRLSEVRSAALIAYWIIKYRPFSIPDWIVPGTKSGENWKMRASYTNEGVALHCILGAIKEIRSSSGDALVIPDDFITRLNHALREHDLSKESMMIIAESLLN